MSITNLLVTLGILASVVGVSLQAVVDNSAVNRLESEVKKVYANIDDVSCSFGFSSADCYNKQDVELWHK